MRQEPRSIGNRASCTDEQKFLVEQLIEFACGSPFRRGESVAIELADPFLVRGGSHFLHGSAAERQILETPHDDTLVVKQASTLGALLIEDTERGREIEGRKSEIERAPSTARNVLVGALVGEHRREQKRRAAGSEVPKRIANLCKRQVGEEVPAENGVGLGKRIVDDIGEDELPPSRRTPPLVLRDDLTLDIDADVRLDAKLHVLHPVQIAARRIENRANAEILKEQRKAFPQLLCLGERRSRAREGLRLVLTKLLSTLREDVLVPTRMIVRLFRNRATQQVAEEGAVGEQIRILVRPSIVVHGAVGQHVAQSLRIEYAVVLFGAALNEEVAGHAPAH